MIQYRKFLQICRKSEKAIEKMLANGERPENINLFDLMPREFLLREEQLRFRHWAYCRFPCLVPQGLFDSSFSAEDGKDGVIFSPSGEEPWPFPTSFDVNANAFSTVAKTFGHDFGLRLTCAKNIFSQVERETEGNSLYSPVSLELAIGLLSEGASGKTLSQLQSFLNSLDYSSVVENMRFPDTVKIANSLWCSSKYVLMSSYLTKTSKSYGALVSSVDFSDGSGVADDINGWCNEKTKGMIPQITSADKISADTLAILCNAIYFESIWCFPWYSCEGKFTCLNGDVKELDEFLHREENIYYEVENAKAFGKLYSDNIEFIGILPDEGKTIDDIDLVRLLSSKTYDYVVDAYMPKLNYSYSVDSLVDALKFLGVIDIFDADVSDFRCMTEDTKVAVSSIVQKCRIELDESGTKASAVTEIECADFGGAMDFEAPVKERKVVRLDRPFYYLIVSEDAGQVLFIGKVNEV